MNQREYERLKKQFTQEYEQKMAALDLIFKATNSGESTEPAESSGRRERTSGLKDTVQKILPHLSGDFTLHDVDRKLAELEPETATQIKKASLSSILKRLEGDGEIVVIDRGSGKRPSVYRLALQDRKEGSVAVPVVSREDI